MADLLPCPFCFKAAAFQRDRDPDGCMWVKVKCTGCGAETRGNRFTDPSGPCPIGYQELRDQWNQRGWDQRIAELEAEVARLREDSARLDWLDANGFTAYRQIDPLDGLSDHCVVVHETQKPRRGNVAATARAAIDAARKGAG